jgi:hypothetical protein
MSKLLRILSRILTLRFSPEDLNTLGARHLAVGLLLTWMAGVGRYWDNPRVGLLQHLGLGSIVYVFVLSGYLFLVVLPLRPSNWSYRHLLIFVTLTSPPALLYAIPVEKLMSLNAARIANFWFLAIVATWRVTMYSIYLRRRAELGGYIRFCATLLPLSLVVLGLTALNLDRAVFEIMAGVDHKETSADSAYFILILLSYLTILGSPILLVLYGAAILSRRRKRPETDSGTGNVE